MLFAWVAVDKLDYYRTKQKAWRFALRAGYVKNYNLEVQTQVENLQLIQKHKFTVGRAYY